MASLRVRAVPLLAAALAAVPLDAAPQAPVRLAADPPPRPAAVQQARDSGRVLRGARSAQTGYERLRFRHLPWTWDSGSGGRCDERIGRFCFWDDGSEGDWRPPPDPAPVRDARDRLLVRLAEAAALNPGDGWIAGQRVRYLVEAGRAAEAVRAAEECLAGWWCGALRGYALHVAGDAAAAEAAFEAALAAMPAAERREWTDLSMLLLPEERGVYRRLAGPARDEVERRFWWLADPLWSVPGNDRRTEHLARLVVDRLQDRATTTEGWHWGEDLREILLRYGNPTGWERIRPRVGAPLGERASVIAHYAPRSWRFAPPLRAARDPRALRAEDYALDDEHARSVYAPAYADDFRSADHQVALFQRGGGAVVVAAYDLDPDSVPAGTPVEAALVLSRDEVAAPQVVRGAAAGPAGVLRAEAAPGPLWLSLEARATVDTTRRIGRARVAREVPAAPTAGIALSDVLLLDGAADLPETLDAAAPRARGSVRVRPGERLGLFWEVYRPAAEAGLAPDTLAVSVAVERVGGPGLGRRLVEAVGLGGRGEPVRVSWRQEADGLPVVGRSLAIALPDVRPGEYLLRISVRQGAGQPVTATRALTVERERSGARRGR